MKQICQRGFKCPFLHWDIDDCVCTYPHLYFWVHPNIRLVIHEDGSGFDVETLKGYEWTDTYSFVSDTECPFIELGSELDPVMMYKDA